MAKVQNGFKDRQKQHGSKVKLWTCISAHAFLTRWRAQFLFEKMIFID